MACKKDPDWNTIIEPETTSNVDNRSCYPFLNLYASELHSLEMDDTPGNERIRLQHGNPDQAVSTFLEIHPDGTEVHKIYGDGYEIVTCNKKVLVKGSCTVVVDGNAAIEVKGNAWSTVKGNYSGLVEGNVNVVSKKNINISADKEISLTADQITFRAEQINTIGDIQLQGDLGMNETTSIQGNLNVAGAVFAACGLLTTGSLVVGPTAAAVPNKTMIFPLNYVSIDVGVGIALTAGAGIIAEAIGAVSIEAGGLFSASAGAAASLSAIGVTSVSGDGGVSISSIGAIGIAAIGALTTSAELTTIRSELVTFPTALSIAAPLTKLLVAPKAILTVADMMCLNNPMFYSMHMHPTAVIGPPSFPLPGPVPVAGAT